MQYKYRTGKKTKRTWATGSIYTYRWDCSTNVTSKRCKHGNCTSIAKTRGTFAKLRPHTSHLKKSICSCVSLEERTNRESHLQNSFLDITNTGISFITIQTLTENVADLLNLCFR